MRQLLEREYRMVLERVDKARVIREVGKDAQFDLRVVRHQEHVPLVRDSTLGLPDARPFFPIEPVCSGRFGCPARAGRSLRPSD